MMGKSNHFRVSVLSNLNRRKKRKKRSCVGRVRTSYSPIYLTQLAISTSSRANRLLGWELDEIKRLSQYYRWGPDRSSARPPPTFAIPIKSKLEIDTTEWLHSRGPWKSDYANRQNHVYTTSTSDEYAMVSESPSGENSSPNTVPTVEHHHLQSDRYPLVYTYPADEFYRLPWASTNPNYSEPWTRPPPFPPHFSPNSWGHSFGPPPKFELPF